MARTPMTQDEMDFNLRLSDRLRAARRAVGYTLPQMAHRMNLCLSTVCRMEAGTHTCNAWMLATWCELTGADIRKVVAK